MRNDGEENANENNEAKPSYFSNEKPGGMG
jgi:hypothetical protein